MKYCCRGSSIKTRIETLNYYFNCNRGSIVAEVVPLKQGLKHDCVAQNSGVIIKLQR